MTITATTITTEIHPRGLASHTLEIAMNLRNTTLALALALTASTALAHDNKPHDSTAMQAGRESANAVQSIDPEAKDAVAALERFSTALSAGDLSAAGAELDPSVLILESGGAERTRDEYLGGHAKHDAEFLKTAHITNIRTHPYQHDSDSQKRRCPVASACKYAFVAAV